ncbi:hypothetical protein O181_010281 [Austropuccinia psidii MF-1]|uniref:Secreted protein n=1 Tax=Austropuccinia psidii MF-1 TaxID=1389203 RepID=A0A9Q3BQQ7_9BASI|nr:hypothetical protein [Austropuccinia psidii MF-1]
MLKKTFFYNIFTLTLCLYPCFAQKLVKDVQCGNAFGTQVLPDFRGKKMVSCTAYGNQPMMCVQSTCTVPEFENCVSTANGKKAQYGSIEPDIFQAYNNCGILDVWKGRTKAGKPWMPHAACQWEKVTDPNNQRPRCTECYAAGYTPFEYGLCPQKPARPHLGEASKHLLLKLRTVYNCLNPHQL